jgi:hypothetical protein
MEKKETGVFKLIEGLKPVDAKDVAAFERAMVEEVIPEIIQDVEKRRMLAAESRQRQLEKPNIQKPRATE